MTDTAALSAIRAMSTRPGDFCSSGPPKQLAAVGAGGGWTTRRHRRLALRATADAHRFAARSGERDASLPPARGRRVDRCAPTTTSAGGYATPAPARPGRASRGDGVSSPATVASRRSLLLVDSNEQAGRLSRVRCAPSWSGSGGSTSTASRSACRNVRRRRRSHGAGPPQLAGIWPGSRATGAAINREIYCVIGIPRRRRSGVTTVTTSTGAARSMVLPPATSPSTSPSATPAPCTPRSTTVDTTHSGSHPAHRAHRPHVACRAAGTSTPRTSPLAPVPTTAPTAPPTRSSVHRDPVATLARILDTSDQVHPGRRSPSPPGPPPTRTARAQPRSCSPTPPARRDRNAPPPASTSSSTPAPCRRAAQPDRDRVFSALDRIPCAARNSRSHDPDAVLAEAVEAGAPSQRPERYQRALQPSATPAGSTRSATPGPSGSRALTTSKLEQVPVDAGRDRRPARPPAPGRNSPTSRNVGRPALSWPLSLKPAPTARPGSPPPDGSPPTGKMRDHDDPATTPSDQPAASQVRQFAAHRAVWRDLGRPDIDREHLELSNGQLRMRVRAYERGSPRRPRYVSNELAGTQGRRPPSRPRNYAAPGGSPDP
ncbi:hypothetical protein HBB16_00040 [Pseudonocardia sp. MCCB 268]|nr:hypothetical protein [Pseudonocardia cytotoxica]